MRSFRQKPVGWRNESYRHYLAAKGFKSKHHRYHKGKMKAVANFLMDDGRAKTDDFGKDMQTMVANQNRDRMIAELEREQQAGNMTFENAQRFMNDDFTTETKDFLDGKISRGVYEDNLNRRLGRHKTQFSNNLSIFSG